MACAVFTAPCRGFCGLRLSLGGGQSYGVQRPVTTRYLVQQEPINSRPNSELANHRLQSWADSDVTCVTGHVLLTDLWRRSQSSGDGDEISPLVE